MQLKPLAPKADYSRRTVDAEKTEHPLQSLAKNLQNNGWPFQFWEFNSGSKGLMHAVSCAKCPHINRAKTHGYTFLIHEGCTNFPKI
jgi:hypothetical protein